MRLLLSSLVVLSFALACSAPPPSAPAVSVVVDATLEAPRSESGRPIDRLKAGEVTTDFVSDRLLLSAADQPALDAAVTRMGGHIEWQVTVGKKLFAEVTLDGAAVDASSLGADLHTLSPQASGALTVSSARARGLLAAVAAEQQRGSVKVSLDLVFRPQGLDDGLTKEAAGSNAFAFAQLGDKVPNYGVGKAWQLLSRTARLGNKVPMVVIDSGFVKNLDLPPNTRSIPADAFGQRNTWQCGGSDCAWHGTHSSTVMAGAVDNAHGAAGVAGPVVGELTLLRAPDNDYTSIIHFLGQLLAVVESRPRVVNMSGGSDVPAIAAVLTWAIDDFFENVRDDGTLVFASAGNEGRDVDDESIMMLPCEATGVLCIGGLANGSTQRHTSSNWGHKQNGMAAHEEDSVDLYGPYVVISQAEPDSNGMPVDNLKTVMGTSFSSPFVAGVAALVWAADPTLSAEQVWQVLDETAVLHQQGTAAGVLKQVDAYAAVKRVVGNLKPTLSIVSPKPGDTATLGLPGVALEADVSDWEDSDEQLTVVWWSSEDGPLTTGAKSSYVFTKLGSHDLHVRVTDSQGATAEASILFTTVPTPPTFTLTAPASLTQQVNKPVTFAVSIDAQFVTSTCRWRSLEQGDGAMSSLGGQQGCQVTQAFATVGTHRLSVTVEDEYGQYAAKSFDLEIVPMLTMPLVTITAPAHTNQDTAHASDTVVLAATITAPGSVTAAWSFQSNDPSCPRLPLTVTAPGVSVPGYYSVLWDTTPAQNVANGCGVGGGRIRLVVTDAQSQTASDEVGFFLYSAVVVP